VDIGLLKKISARAEEAGSRLENRGQSSNPVWLSQEQRPPAQPLLVRQAVAMSCGYRRGMASAVIGPYLWSPIARGSRSLRMRLTEPG
jgi:hypothetical protein